MHLRVATDRCCGWGPDAIVVSVDEQLTEFAGLCGRISEISDAPVLVLVETIREDQRIAALEMGADDCMHQCVCCGELVARLRAHIRRGTLIRRKSRREIRIGDLLVETSSMQAAVKGRCLSLTRVEFELLKVFAERAGQVLRREFLLNAIRFTAKPMRGVLTCMSRG